jgi:hypothetical protein
LPKIIKKSTKPFYLDRFRRLPASKLSILL